MANVTSIAVSTSQAEGQGLQAQGYKKINVSLGRGFHKNPAYIWFKKQSGVAPVTRVQASSNKDMENGLTNAGYTKVDGSLTPIKNVFLWFFSGNTNYDTPIVDLEISTNANDEAEKMKLGWERVCCNLAGIYGWNSVYLWVKRAQQTYICDVTATNSSGSDADLFQAGYNRIDESTNTVPWPFYLPPIWGISSSNFLWYRQSTDAKKALTDVEISTNTDQYQQRQQQNYTPVSVNLNEGAGGNPVYLWYKKMGHTPVETMILLRDRAAINPMEKYGFNVSQDNMNTCNNEAPRYLCVKKKF